MFESIRERLPSRPTFRNPFPTAPVGEAINTRLLSLEPSEKESEYKKLDDAAKNAYHEYLRGRDNRDFFWRVTGVAFVGAVGTAIVVALTSDTEEEDDEDEDEDKVELDLDDEDEDASDS